MGELSNAEIDPDTGTNKVWTGDFTDLTNLVDEVTANLLCESEPTASPSTSPTSNPSANPSTSPTQAPTKSPSEFTQSPTASPSANPSTTPSKSPTSSPSTTPSLSPSTSPSKQPTQSPSVSCLTNPVQLYNGSSLELPGLEVINTEVFDITAGPLSRDRYVPWQVDNSGGCDGTTSQFTAGLGTGVDRRTTLRISIPAGATSVQYYYSYTESFEGRNDDFFVGFDCNYTTTSACNGGTLARQYGETDPHPAVTCAQECLAIPDGNTTLDILCKTRQNREQCSIDQIQFFGTSGVRKLSGSDPSVGKLV